MTGHGLESIFSGNLLWEKSVGLVGRGNWAEEVAYKRDNLILAGKVDFKSIKREFKDPTEDSNSFVRVFECHFCKERNKLDLKISLNSRGL